MIGVRVCRGPHVSAPLLSSPGIVWVDCGFFFFFHLTAWYAARSFSGHATRSWDAGDARNARDARDATRSFLEPSREFIGTSEEGQRKQPEKISLPYLHR